MHRMKRQLWPAQAHPGEEELPAHHSKQNFQHLAPSDGWKGRAKTQQETCSNCGLQNSKAIIRLCDRKAKTLERRGYQHISHSKIFSVLLPEMDEKAGQKQNKKQKQKQKKKKQTSKQTNKQNNIFRLRIVKR